MARRAPDITFSRLRGELLELPGGIALVNDCYNANPISMRAALESLAAMPAERPARSRCSAAWPSWAPTRPTTTARSAPSPAGSGSARSSASASSPVTMRRTSGRRTPAEAVALADELLATGRRGPGEGLAVGRPRGVHGRAGGEAHMVELAQISSADLIDRGEVLIAGMAAMLITIFLGPKFIEFLRVKEFGQQIREEGPQEHHAKAGTPTMGGLILFIGVAVPVPRALRPRHGEPRGLRGRAGVRGDRLRRRRHQDHQAPLARALGPLQAARPDRPGSRPLVRRYRGGRPRVAR